MSPHEKNEEHIARLSQELKQARVDAARARACVFAIGRALGIHGAMYAEGVNVEVARDAIVKEIGKLKGSAS